VLYSIDTGKYITKLPHQREFDRWKNNLAPSDYAEVIKTLNQKIGMSDIHTSSWIPGNDWTGTVYEPLYISCRKNVVAAGLFFGLILFDLLMGRTDAVWGFGRYEKDGRLIRGMTYFLLNNPPPR